MMCRRMSLRAVTAEVPLRWILMMTRSEFVVCFVVGSGALENGQIHRYTFT